MQTLTGSVQTYLPTGANLPPKLPSHRSDRRFMVNQPARLYVPEAKGQLWTAHIRDISRRGMQLVVNRAVMLDARVRIEWNGRDIEGTIRHQRQHGAEYRLGVELVSSWESLVSDVLAQQAEELSASNATLERQAAILQHQADLLDLTYDTILVTDVRGVICSWNHGAEQMYGWSKSEAVGRSAHDLLRTVFPEDRHFIDAEVLVRGRWEGELTQVRRDGSRIVVASRWALQRTAQGTPLAIMAINSDITAKKKTEESLVAYAAELAIRNEELATALKLAREASQVKSRFLASVSHELRTPLNGIIGFSQLLHDGAVGPVTALQQDCLGDVLNCSNHLLTLINHVLDLSKIESGKMEFQHERVRPEDLVRETIQSARSIASKNGIEVRLTADSGVGFVQADPSRIRQVVFNYLSNALKFSPEGGVVDVELRREDESHYRIQVVDRGIGISREDLARLFTEFGQLGPSEKAKEGTGLGLAITKRIVDAFGGRVGVESTPGKGSCFFAVLPVDPPQGS